MLLHLFFEFCLLHSKANAISDYQYTMGVIFEEKNRLNCLNSYSLLLSILSLSFIYVATSGPLQEK